MTCAYTISLLSLPWTVPIPLAHWVPPPVSERTFAVALGMVIIAFFAVIAPRVKRRRVTLAKASLAFAALLVVVSSRRSATGGPAATLATGSQGTSRGG